ncbi:MAG: hypothetical protein DHS20C02_13860 [Micavibrio sp.]|nr:MAG: hypothetical protein DHS20C02_13860 [Micavibrio sp.]
MGLIRWIFGFLVALILAAFAVFNRTPASLTWSPVHVPLELPLYMIGLALMALGFFLGSIITWMNMSKVRQDRRRQKKQIKILEKELEAVNENGNAEAPSDFFPALPKRKK